MNQFNMNHFRCGVTAIRERDDLSMIDVAEKSGMTSYDCTQICGGANHWPSQEQVNAIAAGLGLTFTELLEIGKARYDLISIYQEKI